MFGLEFLEFAVFIYSGGEAVAFRFNRISRNMSGVVTFFLKKFGIHLTHRGVKDGSNWSCI